MNVTEIEIEVNGALASLRLYRDVDLAIAALESVEEKLIANFLETDAGNHMKPLKWEAADAYSRDTIKAALAKATLLDEALAIITTYRQWDDADGHAKTCVCRACCSDELIVRANKLAKGDTP